MENNETTSGKKKSIFLDTEPAVCPSCGGDFLVSQRRLDTTKSAPCCSRKCSINQRKVEAAAGVVPWKASRQLEEFDANIESLPISLLRSWWEVERASGFLPGTIMSRLNCSLKTRYATNRPCQWALVGNLPVAVRRYMLQIVASKLLPPEFAQESFLEKLI